MPDRIDIAHLASLARLSLDDAAQERANHDLQEIIHMIDAMQAISTEGIEPMTNVMDSTQRLRMDQATETVERDTFQAIAPATAQGYYLVPRVVE